jgi:hypothetical protein
MSNSIRPRARSGASERPAGTGAVYEFVFTIRESYESFTDRSTNLSTDHGRLNWSESCNPCVGAADERNEVVLR